MNLKKNTSQRVIHSVSYFFIAMSYHINQANMLKSLFVCLSSGILRTVQDFVNDLTVHGHAVGELLIWLSAQV